MYGIKITTRNKIVTILFLASQHQRIEGRSAPLNNTDTQEDVRPALSAPQSSSCSVIRAHAGPSYLFEAAHEVVANR